ncbi:hypothetical protein AAD001_06510 [Colwelliaceae bacterium 6471]
MTQASLWQNEQQSYEFAELCNALYERELHLLVESTFSSVHSIQGKLRSLPYYVKRTAHLMTQAQTPLQLDVQNATWSTKQSSKMPLTGQTPEQVWQWYNSFDVALGLVIPVILNDHIVLDSIDRYDQENKRFRANIFGWFDSDSIINQNQQDAQQGIQLLKPTKKVMMAACAGHCWKNDDRCRPIIPTLRELLLSCSINWRNFKIPQPI